ncbi:MAG: glycosyltransferase family 2 protein [Streptococcaceae bacterium]|jgi:glycosyltransferase involved in cell wall biosynthesis|nr:glycosyltransferase family 2 protein [Streptococcaceae bacterium]
MTAPLITVILPVYNGEKYLARAIDSVVNQTFGFEKVTLLAINDGGTDDSINILNEYAAKFPNSITVLDQENQGVAKTRNQAISLTTTPYLTFLDQDDYFDLDFLETLYQVAEKTQVDVVSGGYKRPDSTGKNRLYVQPKESEYGRYLVMAAWSKLHRTQFIKDNQIEFFDNRVGEDLIFTLKEIISTKAWIMLPYTGYNWFYNEASVSNTVQKGLNSKDNALLLLLLLLQLRDVKQKDFDDEIFIYFMFRIAIYYLLFSGRDSSASRFMTVYNELFDCLSQIFTEKKIRKIKIPNGENLIVGIVIKIFITLRRLHLVNVFAKFYCRETV